MYVFVTGTSMHWAMNRWYSAVGKVNKVMEAYTQIYVVCYLWADCLETENTFGPNTHNVVWD